MKKFDKSRKLLEGRIAELEEHLQVCSRNKMWDEWKTLNKEQNEVKHELKLLNLLETVQDGDNDLMTLVHDHYNATDNLGFRIDQLSTWLKENQKTLTDAGVTLGKMSTAYVIVEYLRSRRKELMDSLDAYYVKEKSKKGSPFSKEP